MLAVGAGGGCLDIFSLIYHFSFLSSFSLSLGDGPIWTEILSQRAVKPKTTNQPIIDILGFLQELKDGILNGISVFLRWE